MSWIIAAAVVALLWRRRVARRNRLAGLDSAAPTFSLTPPKRWVTSRRDHRL